jgi:multicomponent Na+:H+ antiporter subunit E
MLLINLVLALVWVGLTGDFTPMNFLFGFAIGFAMLWLGRRSTGRSTPTYFFKLWLIIGFAIFFIVEVIKANLRVARNVVSPLHHLQPGIVAVPLDITTDAEITLLANLITLTPGTLSLDVSEDRKVLYVHSIAVGSDVEAFKREIKSGFERRVMEVLR